MANIVNKESDNPQQFWRDRNYRAWTSLKFEMAVSRCYGLKCDKRAFYELKKVSGTLSRRELLCHLCFVNKIKELELKLVNEK